MGSTWLLASCHKEEATARVLKKNMTRKVEAAELLRNRSHSYNSGRSALLIHGTPHFLTRPSQLPHGAGTSIPTAVV